MSIRKFVLVDDDAFSNVICKMMILHTVTGSQVTAYDVPEQCLAYLKNSVGAVSEKQILLLDINMPTITGWEFLDEFETFPKAVKDAVSIFLLSSSVDPCDIARAESNPLVCGFISKPLDEEKIVGIIEWRLAHGLCGQPTVKFKESGV